MWQNRGIFNFWFTKIKIKKIIKKKISSVFRATAELVTVMMRHGHGVKKWTLACVLKMLWSLISRVLSVVHRYRGEIPKLAAIFSRHGEQFGGIRFYSESACVNCIFLRYECVFNRARKAVTSATHIKVIARVICIAHSPHFFSAKSREKKFTWAVLKLWDLCLYICGVVRVRVMYCMQGRRKLRRWGSKVIFPDFFPGVKCFFPVG